MPRNERFLESLIFSLDTLAKYLKQEYNNIGKGRVVVQIKWHKWHPNFCVLLGLDSLVSRPSVEQEEKGPGTYRPARLRREHLSHEYH